jgi:hypothetical protein
MRFEQKSYVAVANYPAEVGNPSSAIAVDAMQIPDRLSEAGR